MNKFKIYLETAGKFMACGILSFMIGLWMGLLGFITNFVDYINEFAYPSIQEIIKEHKENLKK